MATMSSSMGTATRKRSLDEVASLSFVAREDEGGACGALEMPKRFVLECVADKGHVIDDRPILALEAEDARFTAESNRVFSRLDAIIQRLRAENAARTAAATPPHPSA